MFFLLFQAAIRKELNDFKSTEMEVHDDSRHLTRSVVVMKVYDCSLHHITNHVKKVQMFLYYTSFIQPGTQNERNSSKACSSAAPCALKSQDQKARSINFPTLVL